MWIALTGHLSTPREPIPKENPKSATDTTQRSMASKDKHKLDNVAQHLTRYIRPKQNGKGNTHCNPTKLNVKSAILVDSFRPLMEGVPAHLAACGILIIHVLSCTQFSALALMNQTPKSEGSWWPDQ